MQDWKVIDIGNKKLSKKNEKTECVKRPVHTFTKDVDVDTNPIKLITPDLKKRVISARIHYIDPSTKKQGLSQDQFAKLIQIKLADLKLLEQGQIELKKAKQIGIAIEKHLKIKIL